jgi:hypothetical protein
MAVYMQDIKDDLVSLYIGMFDATHASIWLEASDLSCRREICGAIC